MSSYDKYAEIRDSLGYSDYRVAKETGVGTATISNWKNGKYVPKSDKMTLIADFLGVDPDEIGAEPARKKNIIRVYHHERPESDASPRTNISDFYVRNNDLPFSSGGLRVAFRIPVLGRVAAGIPIEATEDVLDFEEITEEMRRDGEYFALKIQGDSMEPKISNGDVVIVRQQEDADDGDIVIALVNGDDAVCKRLKKYQDGSVALISTNPAYDPMFFSKDEIDETPVKIIGRVKELRAKF